MPDIKELNRRIAIVNYNFSQDAAGGNIKTPSGVYKIWAKVEQQSENRTLDNAQILYSKSYRITIRNEDSRPVTQTEEILYDHKKLSIHSISRQDEGKVNFLVLDTYTASNIDEPVTFTADYGWSLTPVNAGNVGSVTYSGSATFFPGGDIVIDFTGMPAGAYVVVRYPFDEGTKTEWYNAPSNYGTIPDQVFDTPYSDQDYYYIWSRVAIALDASAKTITFKK